MLPDPLNKMPGRKGNNDWYQDGPPGRKGDGDGDEDGSIISGGYWSLVSDG